jgi:hypothetical protein
MQQPNSKQRHRILDLPVGKAEVWLERVGPQVRMHSVFEHSSGGGSGSSNWSCCDFNSCLGETIDGSTTCLRHADPATREQYLNNLSANKWLALRGVAIDQGLMDAILACPGIVDRHSHSRRPLGLPCCEETFGHVNRRGQRPAPSAAASSGDDAHKSPAKARPQSTTVPHPPPPPEAPPGKNNRSRKKSCAPDALDSGTLAQWYALSC